jgi:tetratricopeptide (TPR) repeat protein/TolB-like protein/predicted Ser/Thr protein kinase
MRTTLTRWGRTASLMNCPHCHAENDTGEPHCIHCGGALAGFSEAETLAGGDAAQGAAQRQHHVFAAATGVVTPPPSSPQKDADESEAWLRASRWITSLQPGSDFGLRYRIESLLGRGGMGLVFKARDRELDRIVALKLLRPELTANPQAMGRFKQELLLASRISHRHVLRIHDLGDADGVKFISMAYVEGEDLSHLLKKQGRLALEQILNLARQLIGALDAAHSEGIVHRDLKPQNVLIDRQGHAYVSDFGLAKSLESASAMMTHTGDILGTPRYMSPEQVRGEPADHRSDLYALGLMLYEMATGDIPFKGESASQTMIQRLTQKPQNPKLLNPELPDYLAWIILKCLEQDPALRYQSAREILHDLDQETVARSRRSRAVHISVPLPQSRRSQRAAAALLLVVIGVVAGLLIFKGARRQARTPSEGVVGVPSLAAGKFLAVLPFRVLGDQAKLGYVAEGLNESLAAKLFNLKDLHVASPDAVQREAKQGSLSKVARELGVNLAVDGTLQGAGEKIAIVVHLEDLTRGRLLWAQEFTGVPADLLTLEDQISSRLVDALQLHPGGEEMARAVLHPTENVAAYDLYLKAGQMMRGLPDAKVTQDAIEMYQGALKQDPGFALAFAGLADASLQMYNEKKDRFWVEKALQAAQQARELNSGQAQVYMALGNVYSATGKHAEAVEMLKRALALMPNSDEGFRNLGKAYEANGKTALAIEAFKKAAQIDPYYWVNADELGKVYDISGDYDKALSEFQRVIQLEPDNAAGYENVGLIYMQEGDYSRSVPALENALRLSPTFSHYSNLGVAYFYVKRYNDAARTLEKAVEMSPNQEAVVGNLAQAYLFAGQNRKAQESFNTAIALAYKQLQVNPRDADTMADLAIYYASEGQPEQATRFIRNARSMDAGNPQYLYDEAVVRALAGKSDQAFQSLRDAFRKGFPPGQAASDPELAALQTQPQFAQLVNQFSHGAR